MLKAETDRLCNAGRYERPAGYDRELQTKAGEVMLKVPKLQRQTFERRSCRTFG